MMDLRLNGLLCDVGVRGSRLFLLLILHYDSCAEMIAEACTTFSCVHHLDLLLVVPQSKRITKTVDSCTLYFCYGFCFLPQPSFAFVVKSPYVTYHFDADIEAPFIGTVDLDVFTLPDLTDSTPRTVWYECNTIIPGTLAPW
jgi:hypothetical protein